MTDHQINNFFSSNQYIQLAASIENQIIEAKKLNIFSLLDEYISENVLSAFLASLFNSAEKHGLELLFVETLLNQLHDNPTNAQHVKSITTSPFVKSRACTEWITPALQKRRIDILVELRNHENKLVGIIGIENKIDAKELQDQIADYQKALFTAFAKVPKLMLFLTPDKRKSLTKSETHNCPVIEVGFADIVKCIDMIIKTVNDAELIILLKSFQKYLSAFTKSYSMKLEQRKLLNEIFNDEQKRETVKFIYQNLPTVESMFSLVRTKLESQGIAKENFQFFKLQEIKIYLGSIGENSGWVYAMFHCSEDVPDLKSEFVLRIMLIEPDYEKRIKYRKNIDVLQLDGSTGTFKDWWEWVNISVGPSITLQDLGEKDATAVVEIMHDYFVNKKDATLTSIKEKIARLPSDN